MNLTVSLFLVKISREANHICILLIKENYYEKDNIKMFINRVDIKQIKG